MAKKMNKYAGMQDMFIQKEIDDKTAIFEAQRAKLEAEIAELERSEFDPYDSGLSDVETRNEIRFLNDKIHTLEEQYRSEILQLKTLQK